MIKRSSFISFVFYFYLVLVGSGINSFLSLKFGLTALLSPLILFLALTIIYSYRKRVLNSIFSFSLVKWFFFAFLSFVVIGGLVALFYGKYDQLGRGLRYYLPSILIFLAGVLGFSHFLKYKDLLKILITMRWVLMINILVILFNYLTGSDFFVTKDNSRISGFLINPNEAGFAANLLLALEILLLRLKGAKLSWLIIFSCVFVIFIGFSRTAMLTALIIFTYSFVGSLNRIKDAVRFALVVITLGFTGFYFFKDIINENINKRKEKYNQILMLMEGEVNEQTTGSRSVLAELGFSYIKEKPILGHGLHTMIRMEESNGGVHNQYLLLWGDAGIIALVLFLLYHSVFWIKVKKLHLDIRVFVRCVLIAIVLYSLTNHNMYGNKSYMLILSFLTMVTISSFNVRNFWGLRA